MKAKTDFVSAAWQDYYTRALSKSSSSPGHEEIFQVVSKQAFYTGFAYAVSILEELQMNASANNIDLPRVTQAIKEELDTYMRSLLHSK